MISDDLAALTTSDPDCGGPLFSNMVRHLYGERDWHTHQRAYVDGRECRKCHSFFNETFAEVGRQPYRNPPPPAGIPCTMLGVCNLKNQCGSCGYLPERSASVEA